MKLPRLPAWVALSGAATFARAIVDGDWATDEAQEARRAKCRGCDARTPHPVYPNLKLGYCGTAFVDLTAEGIPQSSRSCGCLIAGKTAVASEECPRGLWGKAPRRTGNGTPHKL